MTTAVETKERMVVRLSPTKAACALSCPRKYGYSYIHNIKPRLTASTLVFGSAVHKALEFAAANVNNPRSAIQLADSFAMALKVMDQEGIEYKDGEDFGKLIALGRPLVTLWAEERYPTLCAMKVLGAEVKLEHVLDPHTKLLAYPDIVTEEDGAVVITNYKTLGSWGQSEPGKPPSDDELFLDRDPQLTFEAFIWRAVHGRRPDKLRKEILKKTKTPKIVVAETTRSDEDLDAFGEWLRGVGDHIRYLHATGANTAHYSRDCGWCSYAPLCWNEEDAEDGFYVVERGRA